MKIYSKDIKHVAMLARITLSEEETEIFGRQLSDIVEYIEQLNEIDTNDIEPTSHVMPLTNVFREDIIRASLPRVDMLKNAPDSNEKFYVVPKIIE